VNGVVKSNRKKEISNNSFRLGEYSMSMINESSDSYSSCIRICNVSSKSRFSGANTNARTTSTASTNK